MSNFAIAITNCAISERLPEHDAIGNAFRPPIGSAVITHVDDPHFRIDLSAETRDIPAIGSLLKPDVGDDPLYGGRCIAQDFQCLLATLYGQDSKPRLDKRLFEIEQKQPLVLYQ